MKKWFLELIKTLIAYFSAESKKGTNPTVTGVTQFLGDRALTLGGVKGALGGLGIEFGGAVINETLDFLSAHNSTLFSMTKKELSFAFEKIFKKKGEFSDEVYQEFIQSLDEELLVAEAENNANDLSAVLHRIAQKKAFTIDLKYKASILARFALVKAISIASHGLL